MFVPPPIPTVCEKCLSPGDKQIVCLPSTPVTVKCLFPEDKQMGGRKTSHTYTLTDKCFIHIDMAKKAVYIADTYQFKTKRIDLRRHPASICYCVWCCYKIHKLCDLDNFCWTFGCSMFFPTLGRVSTPFQQTSLYDQTEIYKQITQTYRSQLLSKVVTSFITRGCFRTFQDSTLRMSSCIM